jgi:aryl-alcohol dehydrogenase-like predicted oxidoreductase
MSRLALGTVQLGLDYGVANVAGQVTFDEAQCILSLAKENGVDTLDTAISYGASEDVLGKVGVDGFRIVTKLPSLPADQNNAVGWVTGQVKASLKRLGQNRLHGLLLHRSEDLLGPNGGRLIDALVELKSDGLIQNIGISIYSPTELDEVFKSNAIDLVQAPLNIIDRRMETSGWLDKLKDNGVEIQTRSTFLQGLLLMKRSKIPEKFSRWSNLWDKWHKTLQALDSSPLEACLAYPLSLKQVDKVIVGVDNATQLLDILAAVQTTYHAIDTSFMHLSDLDLINPSNWIDL